MKENIYFDVLKYTTVMPARFNLFTQKKYGLIFGGGLKMEGHSYIGNIRMGSLRAGLKMEGIVK